jgi:DNA polymerase
VNKEISELILDVKEQVKYLSELGVESLEAEMPDYTFSPKPKVLSPKSENIVSRERLEKFVPTDEILKKITSDVKDNLINTEESKPVRRTGMLDSARLSRLPNLPKRSLGSRNFQKNETIENEQKSGEKEMAKTKLSDSLFGDISETLPESNETLEDIRNEIGTDCSRCELCKERTQVVNSVGNPNADLMIIGEAPGADEDANGEPFVGRAGKLLTKIIEAIGMKREDIFIGNINRCRPPGNRQPTLEESETCKPFLIREIAVVRPKVIVVLGNTAMKNLLETKQGITKMRGNFANYHGVKVMPTFHPAYLLRDPRKKREVWEDMKMVKAEIEK